MLLKERKKERNKERKKERKFFLQKTTTHKNNLSFFLSFSLSFFHFPPVSFLAILQILGCAFLLFQVFQCFSPHSSSYSVCFSFCTFFSFLTTFQVLPCEFLIFLVCQVSRYIPGPTVCVSHFPRFRFSCPIPGSIMCVIHFPHFSVFWPYSRSYSVCISFCTP